MLVAAATLCAPIVAVAALAAIAATGGGNQSEMGTLAGTQGLRGTTIGAGNPESSPVPGPTVEDPQGQAKAQTDTAIAKTHPAQTAADPVERRQAPDTRAPAHKPPLQAPPKSPSRRVDLNPPPPASEPSQDPSAPGAPIPSGSSTGPGSPTSSSGSNSGSGSTDGLDGRSGGD
jgi:hypothetical protein